MPIRIAQTLTLTSLKTLSQRKPFDTKKFSLSALHEKQSISIAEDSLVIQESAFAAEEAAVSLQAAASSVAIEQSAVAVEHSSEYVQSSTVAEMVQYEHSESQNVQTFV